jgi:hypothetical protein
MKIKHIRIDYYLAHHNPAIKGKNICSNKKKNYIQYYRLANMCRQILIPVPIFSGVVASISKHFACLYVHKSYQKIDNKENYSHSAKHPPFPISQFHTTP